MIDVWRVPVLQSVWCPLCNHPMTSQNCMDNRLHCSDPESCPSRSATKSWIPQRARWTSGSGQVMSFPAQTSDHDINGVDNLVI